MDTNNNNFTRQNDFISSLILRASELAYVEGAQGASHLLACLHGFIRYMRQDAKWVPLADEIQAVNDYIAMCRLKSDVRDIALPEDHSCFVRHMILVDAVMQVCSPYSRSDAPGTDFEIDIGIQVVDGHRRLIMTVDKVLPEGKEQLKKQWAL